MSDLTLEDLIEEFQEVDDKMERLEMVFLSYLKKLIFLMSNIGMIQQGFVVVNQRPMLLSQLSRKKSSLRPVQIQN